MNCDFMIISLIATTLNSYLEKAEINNDSVSTCLLMILEFLKTNRTRQNNFTISFKLFFALNNLLKFKNYFEQVKIPIFQTNIVGPLHSNIGNIEALCLAISVSELVSHFSNIRYFLFSLNETNFS